MHIAIAGTRGIPASYSGFETSVEETTTRFVRDGHKVRVYCRRNRTGKTRSSTDGIQTVFTPYLPGKYTETFTHTLFSVLHLALRRVETVQLYGAGNGWFVPILRLLGFRVVFLTDGFDWKRQKWGAVAKSFLKGGSKVGSTFANISVVDSRHVLQSLERMFPKGRFCYIPYGARITHTSGRGGLTSLNLREREYFLFVGRFVPEKNVDLLIQAFNSANTRMKLVLVGGNAYDPSYETNLRALACERVVFPGFVFGNQYEELLAGCYAYIQPSFLEGTSPSLLAAMGAGACVLVSDIPENRETVSEAGFFFESGDQSSLKRMLEHISENPVLVGAKRKEALKRAAEEYSWEVVSQRLLDVSCGTSKGVPSP